MHRSTRTVCAVTLALPSLLLAGCSDAGRPTDPAHAAQRATANAKRVASVLGGGGVRKVNMMDACDPASFNAEVGPGTCARQGGMTFAVFIAQLAKHGEVGAWHFSPPNRQAKVGQTLLAVNLGGEVHTFTEVEEFGGGIVPDLNTLSGNPVPAPECLDLDADDFVPPGGTYEDEVEEEGTELYQCCIHPWMRTAVHAKSK
jgi:plastocyanin